MKKHFSISLLSLIGIALGVFAQEFPVGSLTIPFEGNGSVAISKDGMIYIQEYGRPRADVSGSGTRIFKIEPDGKHSIWREDVNGAVGNVLDSKGNYYFNNGNSIKSSTLTCINTEGEKRALAELSGFSGDLLLSEDEQSLLVPSYTHPLLREVTLTGEVTTYLEDERLKGVTGIVYDTNGNILVSNFTTGVIYSINSEKEMKEIATIPAVYPGYVLGYITYHKGSIYATGYGSNLIYKINLNGEVETFAGSGEYASKDGNYEQAAFVTPNGIEIDTPNNRLIITQNGNGKPMPVRTVKVEQ